MSSTEHGGGDMFTNWLAPFCCTDNRRNEISDRGPHKPADVRMAAASNVRREDWVSPTQKCGCGIIFAADMQGNLVVDGFVHGGSAEASKMILKGDILRSVDGKDIRGKQVGAIGPLLLGPPGSKVSMILERQSQSSETKLVMVHLERTTINHRRTAYVNKGPPSSPSALPKISSIAEETPAAE